MEKTLLIEIVAIILLGVVAQWLAWRFRLPSILLLLILGFVSGMSGLIHPDAVLGELLEPFVSLSVGIILFEGGLSLRFAEFRKIGGVLTSLVTVGALVTWIVGTLGSYWILGFDFKLSLLLGAILIVTGPTVIIPLLRHIRPSGNLGTILKWEGIVIDPIGAVLAVLVFEEIVLGQMGSATYMTLFGILKTILIGGGLGAIGAIILIQVFRRYWVPDFLQNGISLTMVLTVFSISNQFQSESGLLAVTVMGVMMANQRKIFIKHIVEFKENLQLLLISVLFIILAARLEIEDLYQLSTSALAFLGLLILVGRPLSVLISTFNSNINWRERIFLSAMAPRGIVAAAVASFFGFRLIATGIEGAEKLVPITFLVIIGTVSIYGLSAIPLARWLRVAQPFPQGLLIAGAHPWARKIAGMLQKEGFKVFLIDSNQDNIRAARRGRLPAYRGNALSEFIIEELNLAGLGRFLGLTPNDEVNSLAAIHFADVFSRSEVYQLPLEKTDDKPEKEISGDLQGRKLFGEEFTYRYLNRLFRRGAVLRKFDISESNDWESLKQKYGESLVPLFVKTASGELIVNSVDKPVVPAKGQAVIALLRPLPKKKKFASE